MYFFEIPALLSALNGLSNQNSQNEYYLTDTLSGILNAGGRAGTYVISDSKEIMGVNDRCQLAEAEKYINNRNITLHMKNGVTFYLPETTLIHSDITIGRDTVIYPGCVLEKGTSIGEACVIGPDTRISNSIIGNHTHIMNSVVTNAAVGDDEKLGPFAVIIAPGL
jgi:bifunctional UDP-N-acetylglucosamine pyrophosphorylase/glucosamine-1-phosphate N-acetyltransferase